MDHIRKIDLEDLENSILAARYEIEANHSQHSRVVYLTKDTIDLLPKSCRKKIDDIAVCPTDLIDDDQALFW